MKKYLSILGVLIFAFVFINTQGGYSEECIIKSTMKINNKTFKSIRSSASLYKEKEDTVIHSVFKKNKEIMISFDSSALNKHSDEVSGSISYKEGNTLSYATCNISIINMNHDILKLKIKDVSMNLNKMDDNGLVVKENIKNIIIDSLTISIYGNIPEITDEDLKLSMIEEAPISKAETNRAYTAQAADSAACVLANYFKSVAVWRLYQAYKSSQGCTWYTLWNCIDAMNYYEQHKEALKLAVIYQAACDAGN